MTFAEMKSAFMDNPKIHNKKFFLDIHKKYEKMVKDALAKYEKDFHWKVPHPVREYIFGRGSHET